MRIFESNGKINFVDDNNVFVGFDNTQDCCESFGYVLSESIPLNRDSVIEGTDFPGFNFDTSFFEDKLPGFYTEEGGVALFKLIKGDETMFLTLYNVHNGYYGHGFEMCVNNEKLRYGCL